MMAKRKDVHFSHRRQPRKLCTRTRTNTHTDMHTYALVCKYTELWDTQKGVT